MGNVKPPVPPLPPEEEGWLKSIFGSDGKISNWWKEAQSHGDHGLESNDGRHKNQAWEDDKPSNNNDTGKTYTIGHRSFTTNDPEDQKYLDGLNQADLSRELYYRNNENSRPDSRDVYGRPRNFNGPPQKESQPVETNLYHNDNSSGTYNSSGQASHRVSTTPQHDTAAPQPSKLREFISAFFAVALFVVMVGFCGITYNAITSSSSDSNTDFVVQEITVEEAYAMSTQEAQNSIYIPPTPNPVIVIPVETKVVVENSNIIIPVPERSSTVGDKPIGSFNPRKFESTFQYIMVGIVVMLGCIASFVLFGRK